MQSPEARDKFNPTLHVTSRRPDITLKKALSLNFRGFFNFTENEVVPQRTQNMLQDTIKEEMCCESHTQISNVRFRNTKLNLLERGELNL